MEDQLAISRIKQGDPGGLEVLVKRYQVKAVYAAYLILQDRSLSEEVTQTAFVRVVEKVHQFDDSRPFSPWFFRIVVNLAVKIAKEQTRFTGWDEESEENSGFLAKWLIDPQPHPEKLFEQKEFTQTIRAALKHLSPEQRSVVVMRYFLEMSEADMAIKLERPVSTIKWWLRSARHRLGILLRASRYFKDQE